MISINMYSIYALNTTNYLFVSFINLILAFDDPIDPLAK